MNEHFRSRHHSEMYKTNGFSLIPEGYLIPRLLSR